MSRFFALPFAVIEPSQVICHKMVITTPWTFDNNNSFSVGLFADGLGSSCFAHFACEEKMVFVPAGPVFTKIPPCRLKQNWSLYVSVVRQRLHPEKRIHSSQTNARCKTTRKCLNTKSRHFLSSRCQVFSGDSGGESKEVWGWQAFLSCPPPLAELCLTNGGIFRWAWRDFHRYIARFFRHLRSPARGMYLYVKGVWMDEGW